ncbi:exodeoxyribonuclease V subunit gamma [Cognatilysobacter segetis]|uniref:exodeoxyribonuclease V subunit gamma n=1 Tax=Cognatilysobacter segetis TaxID=2492394 RepID=UPI0013905C1D|nr:exodeoxyribonuclease V subunit gamma [Lysobacter segetis]
MAAAPDFRLYHSNSLEILAGLMAEELRAPAAGQGLLEPDVVIIPQPSMRRWLQATLAQAHGIAANIVFLTPGEFVAQALDANVEGRADDLDVEAMRWRLLALLDDERAMRDPVLRPLRAYLAAGTDEVDALKAWSLAGELAGTFEKYQAWRRDWLLAWDAGESPRDPQAALWRRLGRDRPHRARRIQRYLERFGADAAQAPAGLPARLFVFATLNVSPDVLRVLATAARAGTLHFYLPSPVAAYWGDVRTLPHRLELGDAEAFGDGLDAEDNPLLQAWGASGRDFMAVLGGYETVHPSFDLPAYDDPDERGGDDATLLRRLKRDLLHRRPPPATPWREALDRADPSLQVHACPTRLREVQVLHDQLRALLEDDRFDPRLQPREIAVLAPDIDPYVPYVEAVFGGVHGRTAFIPYTLADTSPLASEPLAEVFSRLLALPVSRLGLNEVLDLLATPAIAQHAGLDTAAFDRLRDWLADAGACWGLDAAHRARHGAPEDGLYTWQFALDRLLIGHATGCDAMVGDVAGWPDLEGGDLAALDTLIGLVRVLTRYERVLSNAMTADHWRERLLALLAAVLPERPREVRDERALDRLRTLIDEFADAARRAHHMGPIEPDIVRAHFDAKLAEPDTRAPLMGSGVSFGRMVPMRLLPFRAICILGLNDGEFPRADPAGGLNQLVRDLDGPHRRRGDRSLRDDDRFMFLQLLAAANDVFYLSYLGADPRDGSVREPSVLVNELLDVVAAYHADPKRARACAAVRHPLQPFCAEAFGADGDGLEPRRFSYRDDWQAAARVVLPRCRELAPWMGTALQPPEPRQPDVALTELARVLRNPPDAFLRQRLSLHLPEVGAPVLDVEPLVLERRMHDRLRAAVFDAQVTGRTQQLARRLRAQGLLPGGAYGMRVLDDTVDEVRPFAELFTGWRGDDEPSSIGFELDLGATRLHGRLPGVHAHGLARLRFDAPNGPMHIAHGLDWLVACALGRAMPLVQFVRDDGRAAMIERDPIAPQRAREILAQLLALREDGLLAPLPFGAYAGWVFYDGGDEKGWSAAQKTWSPERGFAEGLQPAVRLALRGRDPFVDDEAGRQFRTLARRVFDAVLHARAEIDA